MFELSDFYDYCRKNRVQVIPFQGVPSPGATIRDGAKYAVFLDFSQIPSTRLLRGVCCHEMSHVATGALHKVSSPFELVERRQGGPGGGSSGLTPKGEKFLELFAGYEGAVQDYAVSVFEDYFSKLEEIQ